MQLVLSVIVCTRDRAERLQETLASFRNVYIPEAHTWELLLIDNNSTDNTEAIAREFAQHCAVPLRYIFEPRAGLCRARNRGVQEARGEILAFTDDDCIADRAWIKTIWEEFGNDTKLAGLGGAFFNYASTDQVLRDKIRKKRKELTAAKHAFRLIAGGNMAFRRTVFDRIGHFDPHLDVGTKFQSAGDSDFVYRAFKAGFKLAHAPNLIIHHNHGRKTAAQALRLKRGYVFGRGAVYGKHILQGDWTICKLACREIFRQFKRLVMNLMTGKSIARQRYGLGQLVKGLLLKLVCAIFSARQRIGHVPTGESN